MALAVRRGLSGEDVLRDAIVRARLIRYLSRPIGTSAIGARWSRKDGLDLGRRSRRGCAVGSHGSEETPRQLVSFQQVVNHGPADSELASRDAHVTLCSRQGLDQRGARGLAPGLVQREDRHGVHGRQAEIAGLNEWWLGQDDRALHGVLKLSDI